MCSYFVFAGPGSVEFESVFAARRRREVCVFLHLGDGQAGEYSEHALPQKYYYVEEGNDLRGGADYHRRQESDAFVG